MSENKYHIRSTVYYQHGATIYSPTETAILEWGLDNHIRLYQLDQKTLAQVGTIFDVIPDVSLHVSGDSTRFIFLANDKKYILSFIPQAKLVTAGINSGFGFEGAALGALHTAQASDVNLWATTLRANHVPLKFRTIATYMKWGAIGCCILIVGIVVIGLVRATLIHR